jgi:hypothetical protein
LYLAITKRAGDCPTGSPIEGLWQSCWAYAELISGLSPPLSSTFFKFPTIFSLHSLPVSLHIKCITVDIDLQQKNLGMLFYFLVIPRGFPVGHKIN